MQESSFELKIYAILLNLKYMLQLGVGGMNEGLQILLLDILFQRYMTGTQNFVQKIKLLFLVVSTRKS